jgi:flagellar biosynthesis anti-sigma factor FlgM
MSDLAINPAGHGPIGLRSAAALHHVSSTGHAGAERATRIPGREQGEARQDRIELSDHARLLDRLRQMPDVRQDRVDRIRAAIARGGYDNDARLNSAIERLIEQEDLG